MSGLPDIDVEDWVKNTEYSGYDDDSDIIKVQCMMFFLDFHDLLEFILHAVVLGACSCF